MNGITIDFELRTGPPTEAGTVAYATVAIIEGPLTGLTIEGFRVRLTPRDVAYVDGPESRHYPTGPVLSGECVAALHAEIVMAYREALVE